MLLGVSPLIVTTLSLTAVLLAGPGAVVATYRGGTVTAEDLDSWKRFRQRDGGSGAELPLRDEVEPMILVRELDRRFASLPAAVKHEHTLRWRHFRMALAETRLRDRLHEEMAASEDEIRRAFEADPEAYGLPRHWQLENILKRFPEEASAEDRARRRRVMEEIRERILAGEDFAKLAKEESESETRLLGGSAGAVSLDKLAPEVAPVVAEMKKGDISPVIETREGLTLLRCIAIIEAQSPSLERARRLVSLRLGEERFPPAWDALVSRLDAELAPIFSKADPRRGASAAAVATYRDGSGRSRVTREDFLLYVSDRVVVPAVPAASLRPLLLERVRQEGFLKEAERRGLLTQKDDDAFLDWKEREMRARAVEKAEVEARVPQPTEAAMRAAYASRAKPLVESGRVTLRALKIALKRDRPFSYYEEARKVGERVAAGSMRFEDAAAALRAHAELVDLGSPTADEVWLMGINVDAAVRATPVGGTSRLVQEGRTLWILNVAARTPERPLSFEEARGQVQDALWRAARRRAVAEFRRRLLEEEAVALAP